MALTQSEVLNLFDLIGAVTNNDFVLMQISTGAAKKVNTQVLAAYLGGLVGTYLTTASTSDINKLFSGETITNLAALITMEGLQQFLAKVNQTISSTLTGMATAEGVTNALAEKANVSDLNTAVANLTQAITTAVANLVSTSDMQDYVQEQLEGVGGGVPHEVMPEAAYAELSSIDPDTIYMTYET